jgi:xanthine dehydrogenase accessory factor
VTEILPALGRWRARGERFALATVVATRRTSPRPVGSKLAVSESGELAGSVSGGCVESEVAEHAREVLDGAPPRMVTFGISDELALRAGLPCGGEIDVWVSTPRPDVLDVVLPALERGGRVAHATVVAGEPLGAEAAADDERRAAADAAPDLEELVRSKNGRSRLVELGDRTVFLDVHGPPARLLVIGAVDLAEALCRAAGELGWQTIVADPRGRFATGERLPSADEILVVWPEDALARMAPDSSTAVVVLTHEDRFDLPAIAGALESDAFYVGALGSRRNQERRRALLAEQGVEPEALERLSGPCGLDIGAETPAETAVSILAEILAARAGRGGGRLTPGSDRIHAELA